MYYFDSLDNIFRFGRYKDQTIEDVLINNPSYIDFCIREIPSFMISPELVEQIKVYFPNFIIPNSYADKIGSYSEYMDRIYYYNRNDDDYDDDYNCEEYGDEECYSESTYERYNGSWAQDVEGYSDDDIDTIFDGDPSAYWNID